MKRKTPYRHSVKQHIREGRVVHRYERGKGKKPRVVIGASHLSGPRWRVSRGDANATVSASGIVEAMRTGIDALPAQGETVTVRRI